MSIPGVSELERAIKNVWGAVSPWIFSSEGSKTSGKGAPKPSKSSWLPARQTQFDMPVTAFSSLFIRLAGLSGAAAVALGAYGAHAFNGNPQRREIFETGNRYHLIHSVLLGLVPLTPHPRITGALLVAGMVIFSGGLYGYALWENQVMRRATPFGGVLLIFAWLSMVF